MEIKDLLKKDLMIMDLKASTKMEAIDEMVAKLKKKILYLMKLFLKT